MDEAEKKTILTVDDDPMILRILNRTFGSLYSLEKAGSAEEAIQKIEELREKLSLVVTDLDMPSGNEGLEVVRTAKEAGIPVICHSGNMDNRKPDIFGAGADVAIEKPASPNEYRDAAQRLIDGRENQLSQ